jgi:hypothetical protein
VCYRGNVTAFNGLAQIQIQSHMADGQAVLNTLHINDAGAGSPPDVPTLTALAHEFWTWISGTYLALCTTTCTVDQVVARQVSDPTAPVIVLEAAYPVGTAGSRGTGARQGPTSLCGIASIKTPNASRRFRGHQFLPPIEDVASLSGNNLDGSAAYYTAAAAYIAKLQAGCAPSPTWTGTNLASWTLCIYSLAGAKLSQPSVATAQLVTLKSKVSFLRSRERGGS